MVQGWCFAVRLEGYKAGKLKSVRASEIANIQASRLSGIPAFLKTLTSSKRPGDRCQMPVGKSQQPYTNNK